MALHESIRKAVNEFGRDVIRSQRLYNVLLDWQAMGNQGIKTLMRFILDRGYGERLYMLDTDFTGNKILKSQAIEKELVNNGFQSDYVAYVISCFRFALSWAGTVPKPPFEETRKPAETSSDRDITIGRIRIAMAFVKGGDCMIGGTPEQGAFASFDEKPAVSIKVDDFYLCTTPVTQDLWQSVMGDNPSHFKGKSLPVERVSWEEAKSFIGRASQLAGVQFRFPTEAEWEYAARGGIKTSHCKYSVADDDALPQFAWFRDNASGQSHPVGQKMPNELGLYDMCGNVSEWCQDWYFNSYAGSGTKDNPSGPPTGMYKVYRGGSWNDKSSACRVSKRFFMNPQYRNKQVGLRLAMNIY